jgi:hypothetical protein
VGWPNFPSGLTWFDELRDGMSMRPRRVQLVAGGTAIFAILLAIALVSNRAQESGAALESANEAPPQESSLVQTSERAEAQQSVPPPTSPSTSSPAVEPENSWLLPHAPNDPLTLSFAAESKDPSWSDFMEAQILGAISRLSGLSLVTIDVECRRTLCRVQSAFPSTDARARQRILGVASTLGLAPRPVVAVSNKSGNVVFLAYFGRPNAADAQP